MVGVLVAMAVGTNVGLTRSFSQSSPRMPAPSLVCLTDLLDSFVGEGNVELSPFCRLPCDDKDVGFGVAFFELIEDFLGVAKIGIPSIEVGFVAFR
jgi:hypothetical protein